MKKQKIIRTSVMIMLFFAFAYAKAGLVPVINTSPACNGSNGAVTISATPSQDGPFTYYIYGNSFYQGDSNITTPATFSGLAPGVYTYYIYCATANQQGNFVISNAVNLSLNTTEPVCPSGTAGSATVTVTGGTSPYTYAWSNGSSGQSVTGLAMGLNRVTVTDQNGCYATAWDTIYQVSTIQPAITHSGPLCAGSLAVSATGGVTPYTYTWSNGATSTSVTGLTNNSEYYVIVTDAQGCSATASTVINGPRPTIDSLNTHVVQPSCGSSGSISVVMGTGLAPYLYGWSNGATTAAITGLSQNTYYYLTVTDANECSTQTGYYVNGSVLTQQHSVSNPGCGTATGSISVYAYGGTAPYLYNWNNGNTTAVDSQLTAGTYYYTVSDAGGCSISDSAKLIPQGNFSAQVTVTPILCPATTGGSMTVNVNGTGPYTYLWSNGATTQTLTNLPEGAYYSVTATDPNGCQSLAVSDSVTLQAPFSVALNSTACGSTVTATVTGSTGPYTYLWSNGATTTAISFVLYNYYSVTVSDAHGCTASQSFYPYTSGLVLDSANSQINPTCTTQGGIKATPLNGVAPFTYIWSNGATTDSIGGLAAGYYQVTVTDVNGCTGVGYYSLNGITIGAGYANINPGCGASNGSITLYPYNGTAPYSYVWGNSSTNHSDAATGLTTGSYSYTVTDANGCSITGSDVLTAQGNYTATISATPTSCNTSTPTGAVNVTVVNGGTPPFTFTWQEHTPNGGYFDTTTQSGLTGLAYNTSVYLLSVTDVNGCSDSAITFTGLDSSGVTVGYTASCYNNITGYAYTDLNGNCIMDQSEPGEFGVNVIATDGNGNYYYASTDSTGFYNIPVLTGSYSVYTYINDSSCFASSCTSSYSLTFTGSGAVASGNNFGFSTSPSFDLVVHTGYNPSAPGSTKQYWVYYYNQGSASVNNAVLTFVHDPNLTLVSATPSYSSYNSATQTITWNLGTVPVSSWINWSQQVTMEFNVPSNLALGTLLTAYDSIAPTVADCNPANNVQSLSDVVSASHDPNTKEVSPAGNITPGGSTLNYTIRFQNTGNAPASIVVIRDTLSPLVDPATIVFGASNFPYTHTLSGNGIITFTFSPIYLPDSVQSADSSIGFVSYSVNLRNTSTIGSQVKNTASIYFDQNPAVVTNTTINTLAESTLGLKNITAGDMSVNVTPNPIHDKSQFSITGATGEVLFEIDDVAGQKIFEKTTTDTIVTFEGGTFAPGIYIYNARDAKGNTCTGKVVIAH